jgi:hypothetical protein
MRKDFLNIWKNNFSNTDKTNLPLFQSKVEVYPGSSTEVDKKLDGYRKQMEKDEATWQIVRA